MQICVAGTKQIEATESMLIEFMKKMDYNQDRIEVGLESFSKELFEVYACKALVFRK